MCLLHKHCHAGYKLSHCHKILSRRFKKSCKPQHCLQTPEHLLLLEIQLQKGFSLAWYHALRNTLNLQANIIMVLTQFKAKNYMAIKGGGLLYKMEGLRRTVFCAGSLCVLYSLLRYLFLHAQDHYHSCTTF